MEGLDPKELNRLPFPYKLWLAIHLEFCYFVRWSEDGHGVILYLNGLEAYLCSSVSIFNITTGSVFVSHLEHFGFKRAAPSKKDNITSDYIKYMHKYFRRYRLDLVERICCHKPEALNMEATKGDLSSLSIDHLEARLAQLRHRSDPCFSYQGNLSKMQCLRLIQGTAIDFEKEDVRLRKKINKFHQLSEDEIRALKLEASVRHKSTKNNPTKLVEVMSSMNPSLAMKNYVYPPDTILQNVNLLNSETGPGYAGYYGPRQHDQLQDFFGDYLPVFEEGTTQVKTVPRPEPKLNKTVNEKEGEVHNKQEKKGEKRKIYKEKEEERKVTKEQKKQGKVQDKESSPTCKKRKILKSPNKRPKKSKEEVKDFVTNCDMQLTKEETEQLTKNSDKSAFLVIPLPSVEEVRNKRKRSGDQLTTKEEAPYASKVYVVEKKPSKQLNAVRKSPNLPQKNMQHKEANGLSVNSRMIQKPLKKTKVMDNYKNKPIKPVKSTRKKKGFEAIVREVISLVNVDVQNNQQDIKEPLDGNSAGRRAAVPKFLNGNAPNGISIKESEELRQFVHKYRSSINDLYDAV